MAIVCSRIVRDKGTNSQFGIVGCGMISEFQADALTKVPGAEITAFCDRKARRSGKRVSQFGAQHTRISTTS